MNNESMYDYTAKMNIEEKRNVLLGNHPKIEYVFNRSKKYLNQKMSVCEIGIGDGHLIRLINRFGLKSTGIDISAYLIKKLGEIFKKEGLKVNLTQADISKDVGYNDCFDAVFCLDILEHVKNIDCAIKNIKKMLKKEGFLIATLPWKENLDESMVICPKCHEKFHRVGHFHSFQSYTDVEKMLGSNFQILNFSFVPHNYAGIAGLQNMLIDFLKNTFLRKSYYKDGFPLFKTTCLVIAQFNKSDNSI